MSKGTGPTADLSALSGLAPELAEMLVSVACDIALVLDEGGVIQSVAVGGAQAVTSTTGEWVGQRWSDTVTGDTRDKAQEFLDDLVSTGASRLRHLNHFSDTGSDIPIAYTAVRLGERGPTLAVGRDMRAVTAMQQKLVQAQQDIERDYWQRRQAETRYRLLFQVSTEPVLVLDADTFDVIDGNRAAAVLMNRPIEQLNGRPVTEIIDAPAQISFRKLLDTARQSARATEGETRLANGMGGISVSITPFQNDPANVLLLRARPVGLQSSADERTAESHADAVFSGLVKRTTDSIVISDLAGRITLANPAFRELVQIADELVINGRALSEWIGNQPSTIEEILSLVSSQGFVRLLSARLRRPEDRFIDIELSATLIADLDSIGFIIRASHHPVSTASTSRESPERDVH